MAILANRTLYYPTLYVFLINTHTKQIALTSLFCDLQERQELDFLKFFESVNQLVENVCNPAVAFTSAPLNENDIPIPDEAEVDESASVLHQSHNNNNNTSNAMMMDSYFIVTDPKDESMVAAIQKQLGSLSINGAAAPNTADHCKSENEKLRIQLAHLKKRLKSLQMVRDCICFTLIAIAANSICFFQVGRRKQHAQE